MKTTKRFMTLALAVLLTLALAIPAMAAEGTGTISVTRATGATGDPTVYSIYQIFDTNPVVGGHTYKLTEAFAGFTAPGYFSVNNSGYVVWEKNPHSVADAAAVAQLAKKYMTGKTITPVGTVTAGSTTDVAPGYYLLVPAEGPCGVVMVEAAGVIAEVQEKTTADGHPTVEKLVFEDSTNRYQTFNTVDYGQTIQYQTIITVGAKAENYILHDQMDDHIEYTNAFTLLRDGNVLPATNNYEIVNNPDDETCDCTFHVVFTETLCKSLHDGAKIVVQYTGKLKPGAETQTAHKNTTWLTYKTGVPSNKSTVSTATFSVTVHKKDQAGNALAGATFVMKDNVGSYYSKDSNGNVIWTTLENAMKLETTTENNGTIVFDGVDAENFVLEEIVVPNGYTGITNVEATTKVGTNGEGENEYVEVENILGEALPETGGIGTTVFYVVGIVLVLGALATLVIIKRKETTAQ